MIKNTVFSFGLPAKTIVEIQETGHPEDYAIYGVINTDLESMYIACGDYRFIKVPISIFEPTANGIAPDFTDFEITDCGQTLRFGSYEAAFDAVLAECSE